jgi:cytochrome c oxidase assembly protein subunit 11
MKFSRNDTVLVSCVAVVIGMVGMSYAAVPLYYMFCAATGYAGTPARADTGSTEISERTVTVRFDSNVDPNLPWRFQPDQRSIKVQLGENKLTFFTAENTGGTPVTGHATFNVMPERAARYFTKIECFCFTEQTLEAGQAVEMPVTFFVDPRMAEDRDAVDISEITLSYTFFRSVRSDTASLGRSGDQS